MSADLQGYEFPLIRHEQNNSAAGTLDELEIGPVPTKRLWRITWFAMEDETTGFTSLRVYIKNLGYNHYLLEDYSCLAARLYWHEGPIDLTEGQSLVFRFSGATAADVLQAYATGFQLKAPWMKDNV